MLDILNKMENLGNKQKRIVKLKRRNINISGDRLGKQYIKIIAKKNYRVTEEIIKAIKVDLLTPKGLTSGKLLKFYTINITMKPNKILTNKGILVRMGKGKAKTLTNVYYLTTGTSCIVLKPKELTTTINMNLVSKILEKFTNKYSFLSTQFLI